MLGTRRTRASGNAGGGTGLVGTTRDANRGLLGHRPSLAYTGEDRHGGSRGRPDAPPHATTARTVVRGRHHAGRFRPVRRALRVAGLGHRLVGHARPHVALGAPGDHLPRGRFPQHRIIPARHLRRRRRRHRPRPPDLGPPVRAHRGPGRAARADRGHHGPGGRPRRRGRHHGHERRAAGDRPLDPHVREPGRHDPGRGPDLPGRGALLHHVRGSRRAHPARRRRAARGPGRGGARPPGRRGAPPEAALHDPQLPQPRRRHHVAGAPRAPDRDRPRARAADRGGQPLRPDPLRGRGPAHAVGARRRRRVGDLPLHVLQDPRPGRARGLGGGARRPCCAR